MIGRNTTGVKLISIDANKDVFVASFARVKETENDADIDMEPVTYVEDAIENFPDEPEDEEVPEEPEDLNTEE